MGRSAARRHLQHAGLCRSAPVRSAPGATMSERFLRLLERSTLMNDCRDAELIAPVRAIDATPYLSSDCVAPSQIELGDAALAIDPISSSGVQKAIQSALSGAIVANTLLRRPESTDAALSFYRAQLGEASERHRRWAADHYRDVAERCGHPFWQQRAAPAGGAGPGAASARSTRLRIRHHARGAVARARIRRPRRASQGDFVSARPPLCIIRVSTSPIAFLGGRELAPLLRALASRHDAAADRAILVGPHAARIRHWRSPAGCVNHGILVEQHGSAECRHESDVTFGLAQARTSSERFIDSSSSTMKSIWRRCAC